MNGILRSSLLLAGFVVFGARPAGAQPAYFAAGQMSSRLGGVEASYDARTEVTLVGTVGAVRHVNKGGTVTHLILNANHAQVEVHLGPSSWIEQQSVSFKVGDQIEIIGSRVKYAGADVVVARQIRKGEQTLTLRSVQGISRWSRGE